MQSQLDAFYARAEPVEPDSGLDQVGLRDGLEHVEEYVEVGEWGLALEHLLYMLYDTGVELTEEDAASLEGLVRAFGVEDEG